MNDLSETISPKSDQLNADDLITGPKKIRVVGVVVQMGEQPVSIFYEGDNGKPYKPGKSMRRVLCKCWGTNGDAYVGREMVLFCDEGVTWGGKAVGGIRISHLSHIPAAVAMPLTDKKGSRKLFTVNPLRSAVSPPKQPTLILSATAFVTPPQTIADMNSDAGTLADSELSQLFAGNEAALLAYLLKIGWITGDDTLVRLTADKLARIKAKPEAVAAAAGITLKTTSETN